MAYILLVDDDPDFTKIVEKVLTSSGHEVGIIMDSSLGEAAMEERVPDLAILDVMFPFAFCFCSLALVFSLIISWLVVERRGCNIIKMT